MHGSLSQFLIPLRLISSDPSPWVSHSSSFQEVAVKVNLLGYALLALENDQTGLITNQSLVSALAGGLDPRDNFNPYFVSSLTALPASDIQDPLYLLSWMKSKNLTHIGVTSETESLLGILQRDDLLSCLPISLTPIHSNGLSTNKMISMVRTISEYESNFQNLAEILGDILWEINQDGLLTYISPQIEQILGSSATEVLGFPFWSLLPPRDQKRIQRLGEALLRDHHSFQGVEIQVGHRRTILEVSGIPLVDSQGKFLGYQGIARDITHRKETEFTLKRLNTTLEQRLERDHLMTRMTQRIRGSLHLDDILNTAVEELRVFLETDSVSIYDLKSRRFVASSNRLDTYETIRFSIEQIPISDPQNLVFPIEIDNVAWGFLVASYRYSSRPFPWDEDLLNWLKPVIHQLEMGIQQAELYAQLESSNQALEYEVKVRNAQLQRAYQSENLLRTLTEALRNSLNEEEILQIAIQSLSKAVGAHSCNAAIYELEKKISVVRYEYSTLEIKRQGTHLSMEYYPELYHPLLQGSSLVYCPIYYSDAPVIKLACPLVDDLGVLGDLWLTFAARVDVSPETIRLAEQVATQCAIAIRQSRLYQAAQDQVLKLEQLNQLKDDFIATVSHDLRTPLTSMRLALRMMSYTTNEQKRQQYLVMVVNECERQIELVNDLLDLQRLESQRTECLPTFIPLQDWIQELIRPMQEQFVHKGVTFSVSLWIETTPFQSDANALGRIIRELLNNALKYTDPTGQVELKVISTPNQLELLVSNTGEIPESEIPRIFEKFYRIAKSDRWKHGGTGLGLALVKQLVLQLSGEIEVFNHNGSVHFKVRIPSL
jgi:PAS domain S-box-containing protein